MFNYDPYENGVVPSEGNCFADAVRIALELGANVIYWMREYGHYYVVPPGEVYARGECLHYPRLRVSEVLENGVPHIITASEEATFGSEA